MFYLFGNNGGLNEYYNELYIVFKRFWKYMYIYLCSKEIYNFVWKIILVYLKIFDNGNIFILFGKLYNGILKKF